MYKYKVHYSYKDPNETTPINKYQDLIFDTETPLEDAAIRMLASNHGINEELITIIKIDSPRLS